MSKGKKKKKKKLSLYGEKALKQVQLNGRRAESALCCFCKKPHVSHSWFAFVVQSLLLLCHLSQRCADTRANWKMWLQKQDSTRDRQVRFLCPPPSSGGCGQRKGRGFSSPKRGSLELGREETGISPLGVADLSICPLELEEASLVLVL